MEASDSQSGVPEATASASPGNFLEMKIPKPIPDLLKQNLCGGGVGGVGGWGSHLFFNKPSCCFPFLNFEKLL